MNKPLWYKTPSIASMKQWNDWSEQMKKDYPIQYFVRQGISDLAYDVEHKCRDAKYAIKCFFKPHHADIRKAVPRTWADVTSLIIDVNFAMILSFKKEADESYVDWDGTEKHREFKNWLDSAAHWIAVGKVDCEKQRDALYPPHPLPEHMRDWSYDQLYGELNKIEKLFDDTNTNILKQMIDYREYFWT
jgi:hypothetical protein